jgi:hypothetical protein
MAIGLRDSCCRGVLFSLGGRCPAIPQDFPGLRRCLLRRPGSQEEEQEIIQDSHGLLMDFLVAASPRSVRWCSGSGDVRSRRQKNSPAVSGGASRTRHANLPDREGVVGRRGVRLPALLFPIPRISPRSPWPCRRRSRSVSRSSQPSDRPASRLFHRWRSWRRR